MKKIILGLMMVLPVFASAEITQNLKYGSVSPQVSELQEFLASEGIYSGPITGNFYSLTLQAVKNYQSKEGISPASGFVGPLTRSSINAKLTVDTSAEIAETGTVTAPVVSTDNLVMQKTLADLLAQIKSLQDQQKSLADSQKASTEQTNQTLGAIVQNTTPTPVAPVIVPVDKSEILTSTTTYPAHIDYPLGRYIVTITLLNQEGKTVANVPVTMTSEDNIWGDTETRMTNPVGQSGFGYFPKSKGAKTINFTSGSLTKTITIEVQ